MITKGNNRKYIFKEEKETEEYFKRVIKYIGKYNEKLYAYLVMDKHWYLLIEVPKIPLAKIMQLIKQTYTIRYIHQNLVRAKISYVF